MTTAVTSWKAVKEAVVGVGAVVAVAVSDPVDSVVDIAVPAKRAKKASGAVAAVVSVAALGAARVVVDSVARSGVGDRRVELEVGAVDVADVEALVATTAARAALKFRRISPFFRLRQVFFLSSA